MDNKKVSIDSFSSKIQLRSFNLDKSDISTNSYQGLNLYKDENILNKNFQNDINNLNNINYKNNSELYQQNYKKNNYILKRILFLTIILVIIFYMNHISEKKNFKINEKKNYSQNSCIIEIFPEDLYKSFWKFFIVNKDLKNLILTVLYYFYDIIFLISCLYWILNIKKENWNFLFSSIILGFFKYFCLEFYLIKNHEDILWKIPKFPFFLTIQNKNGDENHFFSSSICLFIIMIKHLEDNKLGKLKKITFIFLIFEIGLSIFLKIQNIFGVVIGLLLGLYINKISNEFSKIFNLIYDFNETGDINKIQNSNTINFENKIKENIENILKNNRYLQLNDLNGKNVV